MKYKYRVTQPSLPPEAKSPIMNEGDMEQWLNDMDKLGWEFIGFGQKLWHGDELFTQTWWIFRKELEATDA